MILLSEILASVAYQTGISTPGDPNFGKYNPEQFPHYYLFNTIHLGSSVENTKSHFHNAKIIKNIPDEDIKRITLNELIEMGIEI